MDLKPFKVSEINQYIKRIVMGDPILYDIAIEGEVSNFKYHYNGNMYFTLKDEKSKIRCVYFNNNEENQLFIPEDGMNIIVRGYISIYERDGTYQLYIKDMRKKGYGELYEAFEKLKKKLEKEGMFDTKFKKELTYLPKKIGVATSSTGAAIKDIISVIKRRMPSVDIVLFPVLVQGDKSPDDLCSAIKYFNKRDDIDLIIIGRGGGSIEELWAFNEEKVARAIFNSKLPIISAVGHETDFTIADFVADMRAPTPSVAGELAVPKIDELNYRLKSNMMKLTTVINSIISMKRKDIESLNNRLMFHSPINTLNENRQRLDKTVRELIKAIERNIGERKKELDFFGEKLNSLSPLAVLNRGYSIVTTDNGHIIKSIKEINIDDDLNLKLSDGSVKIKIIEK